MRLQKLLASSGLGSRRSIEEWIRARRITVGGRIARLGDHGTAGDDIRLDGKRLKIAPVEPASHELLLYYKPEGEVTTRLDPQGRPTVFERLPEPRRGRWVNVGRLDVNTTGVLLLTTDGRLAHQLMHPSGEIEREYLVRIRGRPDAKVLGQLLMGVALDDGPGRFDRIAESVWDEPGRGNARGRGAAHPRAGSHSTFRVVLHEGRNREVRRLWQAVGFEVSRLMRIRYGPVALPGDLKPGQTRVLGPKDIERLRAALPVRPRPRQRPG